VTIDACVHRRQVEERSVVEGGDVHIVVRAGSPARILAEEAADPGCLVVVVGASDKRFMGAMMRGKTAGQTLATVSKPFLLVHGEPRDAYRRVVAAIDFENHSPDALREAIPLGLVPDNIRLIHAFTPAMARSDPTSIQRKKEEISRQFRDLLREIDLDPSHVGAEMREGPAFTTVSNFLEETNADLVILGCHGKGPLTPLSMSAE
jgi:nucleotide-binding universal stress UspA family protein